MYVLMWVLHATASSIAISWTNLRLRWYCVPQYRSHVLAMLLQCYCHVLALLLPSSREPRSQWPHTGVPSANGHPAAQIGLRSGHRAA